MRVTSLEKWLLGKRSHQQINDIASCTLIIGALLVVSIGVCSEVLTACHGRLETCYGPETLILQPDGIMRTLDGTIPEIVGEYIVGHKHVNVSFTSSHACYKITNNQDHDFVMTLTPHVTTFEQRVFYCYGGKAHHSPPMYYVVLFLPLCLFVYRIYCAGHFIANLKGNT